MKWIIGCLLFVANTSYAGDMGTFTDSSGRKGASAIRIYYIESKKVIMQAFKDTKVFDTQDGLNVNTYYTSNNDGSSIEYLDDESFLYTHSDDHGGPQTFFLKKVKSCK